MTVLKLLGKTIYLAITISIVWGFFTVFTEVVPEPRAYGVETFSKINGYRESNQDQVQIIVPGVL